jgi:predicted transcriptional regulator
MPQVKEVMTGEVISVNINTPVSEVVKKLVSNNISGVVVIDNVGDMVGVISALDIFKLLNERKNWDFVAEDIMTPYAITITPDTEIEEAAKMMLENSIHRLIVTLSPTKKKPVGILSSTDILKEMEKMV